MKTVSRISALTFATLLLSGAAIAAETQAAAAPASAKAPAGKTTTHEMTATVVSMDAKAHTITIKDEQGNDHTAPCMGNAIKEMSSLKAGQKVTCTCKDSAEGKHLGVVEIKPVA